MVIVILICTEWFCKAGVGRQRKVLNIPEHTAGNAE